MHLVVGLGNPGDRYRDTRHNVGFEVVDALTERAAPGVPRSDSAWWALETTLEAHPVVLLKPLTFMNRSGLAVAAALERWGAAVDRLVVVVDDVALPTGRLRVRPRGSHGGHNGLRSIEEALGTRDFARVRIGVGSDPQGPGLADYVLSGFPSRDILTVRRAVGRAAEAVLAVLREGVEAAMNRYNAEAVESAPEGAGTAT
jgi:PTH1 family peptidyl-tRNA hydrolase